MELLAKELEGAASRGASLDESDGAVIGERKRHEAVLDWGGPFDLWTL
jgi:hypothetical protein